MEPSREQIERLLKLISDPRASMFCFDRPQLDTIRTCLTSKITNPPTSPSYSLLETLALAKQALLRVSSRVGTSSVSGTSTTDLTLLCSMCADLLSINSETLNTILSEIERRVL